MENISIERIELNQGNNKERIIVEFCNIKEDYVIRFPNKITRTELVDLVEEIKQMTKYDE